MININELNPTIYLSIKFINLREPPFQHSFFV